MKGLSIEQKAKAYDEAIERAKEINNEQRAQPFNIMTRVFPELAESEDEKIIKELLQIAKESEDSFYMVMTPNKRERLIAWLEKQERKPADSYCQENCKGFQETGKCFADGECKAKREAEQKPAWSEEDNEHLERILKELKNQWQRPSNRPYLEEIESDYNWLKSLRPQSQWKPSDEQIKVLEFFIPYVTKCSIVLEKSKGTLLSLLSDLKKLKG